MTNLNTEDNVRRVLISLIGYYDTRRRSPLGRPAVEFTRDLNPYKTYLIVLEESDNAFTKLKRAAQFTESVIKQEDFKTNTTIVSHKLPSDGKEVYWKLAVEEELNNILKHEQGKGSQIWFNIHYGPKAMTDRMFHYLEETGEDVHLIRYMRLAINREEVLDVEKVDLQGSSKERQDIIIKEKQKAQLIHMTTDEFRKEHPEFIANSPEMSNVIEKIIYEVFPDYHILITGERGTGKEVVAKAIHENYFKRMKFNTVNCSVMQGDLIRSELFGHTKGAFTGATEDKKGILEVWDKDVVFLDEIANMDPKGLPMLLRLLQDGTFYRIGDIEEKKFKGVIIAATNKDVYDPDIFPQDILDRFDLIIYVPPLRDRRDDIPELIKHFRKKAGVKSPPPFAKSVINCLRNYSWPGNIRELEIFVKHTIRFFDRKKHKKIILKDIEPRLTERFLSQSGVIEESTDGFKLKEFFKDMKSKLVGVALDHTGGNKAKAARLLGVSPSYVKKWKPQ
ncbi:MAG: sigma 54 response regulator [Candidatus Scalindua rubra]|uniref:Sigma 54 response regulator n=1 Tax=Candidatus Scalindua rubra TaxID=1872076 RepID=A0A1E3X2H1_9BACT|nr:MAG: sigma 54 response regulator [Candidatus Scalindua rubra]